MSANLITIARPYAKAAFEYALAHNDLPAWDRMLQSAALVIQNPTINALIDAPQMMPQQLAEVITDVLAAELSQARRNFIFLLAEHKRLPVLPAIASQYAEYCAEHAKTIHADVSAAIELPESYKQQLTQTLTHYLKRQVSLTYQIDPTLIGGVLVRAGDRVIDGTVRGKLNRLLESL